MDREKLIGLIIVFAAIGIFIILFIERSRSNINKNPTIIRDIEGNEYRTVRIGGQVWMAENLRSTKASDGSAVKNYYPNNDTKNTLTYGRLYDYRTAKKICPAEWHLPTDND
jgi:hypothetical protein